ncbi:hypothetical protein GCM10027341_04200 [Spirosoma knui]
MRNPDLESLLNTIDELPFVDQATYFENDQIVAITLTASLARLLPVSKAVLTIPLDDLSVTAVYTAYKEHVIDHLQQALDHAKEFSRPISPVH